MILLLSCILRFLIVRGEIFQILYGGDFSQPEDLVRIIFNYLADDTDEHVVTFSGLAKFVAPSIVGTIDEKIRLAFKVLSNRGE